MVRAQQFVFYFFKAGVVVFVANQERFGGAVGEFEFELFKALLADILLAVFGELAKLGKLEDRLEEALAVVSTHHVLH